MPIFVKDDRSWNRQIMGVSVSTVRGRLQGFDLSKLSKRATSLYKK